MWTCGIKYAILETNHPYQWRICSSTKGDKASSSASNSRCSLLNTLSRISQIFLQKSLSSYNTWRIMSNKTRWRHTPFDSSNLNSSKKSLLVSLAKAACLSNSACSAHQSPRISTYQSCLCHQILPYWSLTSGFSRSSPVLTNLDHLLHRIPTIMQKINEKVNSSYIKIESLPPSQTIDKSSNDLLHPNRSQGIELMLFWDRHTIPRTV